MTIVNLVFLDFSNLKYLEEGNDLVACCTKFQFHNTNDFNVVLQENMKEVTIINPPLVF
jgi:hypothetical protein